MPMECHLAEIACPMITLQKRLVAFPPEVAAPLWPPDGYILAEERRQNFEFESLSIN